VFTARATPSHRDLSVWSPVAGIPVCSLGCHTLTIHDLTNWKKRIRLFTMTITIPTFILWMIGIPLGLFLLACLIIGIIVIFYGIY
jgi:hypothetical protein